MREFGKLWAAGTISSIGDGVTQAAAPLLAASLTRDPVLISGLMIAGQLPWVLFTLPSGALVDRVSELNLVMSVTSLVRVFVLGVLGVAVLSGHIGLPLLYAVSLLAGCAGVVFENASMTAVPETTSNLARANGRMLATRTLGQSLLAPPLGAWLFTLAAWTPFLLDSSAFVLVAVLCLMLSIGRARGLGPRVSLRAAIGEGLRWQLRNRLLRTLAITVGVENLGLGAVLSIMVLIAQDRLGVGSLGYGLLLTASAVGGVFGGLFAERVVRWIGPGTAIRFGLVLEVLVHIGLALTRDAVLAGIIVGVLGFHLVMFSTINLSVRQSAVPAELLGRVHSAYRLVSNGGMLLGAALGGVLAKAFGLTTSFWVGAAAVAVVTVCVWRVLSDHQIRAALSRPPAESAPPGR
jgi:MFS family permease